MAAKMIRPIPHRIALVTSIHDRTSSHLSKFARTRDLSARTSCRQSMGSKAWLGAAFAVTSVALAPTLSACGGMRDTFPTKTVTATAAPTTTTTTSQRDALRAWHEATLVPAQEVRDAMGKAATAAEAYDLTSMGIDCQEAHDAVEQFQQHMPSPDPALTAQLQKALSDYNAAAAICTTAVENHNIDDFAQGGTLISEANTYMDNAVKILDTDLGESSSSAAPPSPSSPSIAAKTTDPEAASPQQLPQFAASDRPFVSAQLADRWIPQLSSKRSTQPWTYDSEDGVAYDTVRILQEHRQLRQQYPGVRLLWSGDWSTFSAPNFWVTVVGSTFPESSGALAWCTSHGLDSDHCAAKIVSTTHPIEGSSAYN
jgi:hypothetical protein